MQQQASSMANFETVPECHACRADKHPEVPKDIHTQYYRQIECILDYMHSIGGCDCAFMWC